MSKINKKLTALALVLSMSIGGLTSVYGVTSEQLNNKVAEDATLVEKVDGANLTGSFRVNMSDATDNITVYQLATMEWDTKNNTFKAPEWVNGVKNWFETNGSAYSKYDTPEKLAAATSSIQTDFFKAVLGKMDGVAKATLDTSYSNTANPAVVVKTAAKARILVGDATAESLGMRKVDGYREIGTNNLFLPGESYNNSVLSGDSYDNKVIEKVTVFYKTEDDTQRYTEGDIYSEAENGYYTVTDIPIGIYGILGATEGGGKTYAPVTVSLIPNRDGAAGNWYLSQEIVTDLKAADIKMEKTINGKKSDIVEVGEDVDFEITYNLPYYTERAVNNNTAQYTLTFDDELSDAFTLDQNSVVVKYRTSETTSWDNASIFDKNMYSSFISAPRTDANNNGTLDDDYGLLLYGCSTSHLYLYTIYEDKYKYYITSDDRDLEGFELADATHSKPYATDAKWDKEKGSYYLDYYAYYYYRDGAYHLIKCDKNTTLDTYYKSGSKITIPYATPSKYRFATISNGSNWIRAIYSSETYDTIGHGWTSFSYGGSTKAITDSYYHNVFNITFDYAKIIASGYSNDPQIYNEQKNNGTYDYDKTTGIFVKNVAGTGQYVKNPDSIHKQGTTVEVQITYKAQVNRDCKTGAETNTNVARMKYEANGSGTIFTTIEDKVNAYTYGVNVVKVDGDTTTNQNPTYLSGAKFKLYKETDVFVEDEYAGSMADSKTTGLTAESTLEDYKKTHTGDNYYYYEYKAEAGGELDAIAYRDSDAENKTKVSAAAGNKVVRVFELVTLKDSRGTWFDGTITSTNTAAGSTISGLASGNYVLVETQAPTGYNKLAEDMLFSIYPMDKDEADTNYAGSYAVYADDSTGKTVNDDNGIYEMSVLNYKGLTLPSTGGMGTLLFTIIGILIMMAAVILVIVKSKKNAKDIATFMALALLVGIVALSSTQDVYAITEVTLNNKYGTLVTGANTVDFTINLKNPGDTVEVYQIAELKWDANKNTYEGPEWVLGVHDAVEGNATYKAYAKTPETLGASETAKQIEFLDWIYDNRETNNLGQTNKVEDAKIVLAADNLHYTVKGVPYGIYMIKAQNSTTKKEYQLLTVNAMPTQQGPVGAWYLENNIVANLKFSNITASKTIDGKSGETVKTGQKVTFDITGEVPDYPEVAKEDGSKAKYPFAVTDTMSAAFEYDAGTGITVEYTTAVDARDNATVWTAVPADKYTYIFKKAATSTSTEGIMLYKDNNNNKFLYCDVTKSGSTFTMDWYAYNPSRGVLTKLGHSTGNSVPETLNDVTIRDNYVAALGVQASSFTRTNVNEFEGLQNVSFDYDYLHSMGAKNVKISYKATVTTAAVVGADTNTNTATFYYQKNLVGDPGTTESTVYAWTYALKVVKSDGDKANSYLAGAKFKLYQEAYTFVPNEDGLDTTSKKYANYVYSSTKNGYEESFADLKEVDDVQGGDYYYRIVDVAGECTDNAICKATEAHKHIIAYALYTFKDAAGQDATIITSVATADGVTISGLAPASYVLIETEAPAGYNRLEEALRFEITELEAKQANELYTTESLRGFISDEEYTKADIDADKGKTLKYVQIGEGGAAKYYKAYVDGVYPIDVKNYAGLTLPSTGGMGTLIFTIVGISVMGIAMVIILAKKRQEEY